MNSRPRQPLNTFVTLQRGFDLPSKDRLGGGVPVVASTGIGGYHTEAKASAPGVVIGRSGSIGGGQYITEDFWPLNTTLWVKDFKGHAPRYVYYLMRSIDFRSFNVGTGVPTLNRNHLSSIEVIDLGKDAERKIANALGSLDDKIQLNQQINQTLEQMAQAIFKSWFVDFEPVKAKIAARERWYAMQSTGEPASPVCYADDAEPLPDLETWMNLAAMQAISGKNEVELTRLQAEQPEQYAELRATAKLFPSAMQDSELGEIPEGWVSGILSDIAEFTSSRTSRDELSLETYISTENMLENRKGVCPASSLPSSPSVPSFEPGEILISNIRPYFKKIWLATISGGRSPDVLGFSPKHKGTNEYLFNLLYQDGFFEYMMLTSKGAKMPRGDKKAIMQLTTAVPSIDLMKHFSGHVRPFYMIATSHNRELVSLASLRDSLLPKLLSGELSVIDAENQLTEEERMPQEEIN